MSETEETIEIEVEKAEKPEIAPEPAEKPAEKAVAPEISPEEGIETFKRQLEAEKLARIEAERRAEAATRAAYEARGQVEESNLQIVIGAIDTLKRESEILKANLRNAMASGDHDAAADAQEALADAKAKLLQLENGKAALQEQAKQPRAPIEKLTHHDPVEAMAANLTPRSAEWVRAHPEYARNERLTKKMIAAHHFVMADGVAPDSDEYFEAIERVLGVQSTPASAAPAAEAPMSAASAPSQRRSSPAAAPVSRSGSGTGGGRSSTVVTLTPQEREMASIMRMSDEEYAKHKHALIREGKLTRH